MLFINLEFKKAASSVITDVLEVLKKLELIALFASCVILGKFVNINSGEVEIRFCKATVTVFDNIFRLCMGFYRKFPILAPGRSRCIKIIDGFNSYNRRNCRNTSTYSIWTNYQKNRSRQCHIHRFHLLCNQINWVFYDISSMAVPNIRSNGVCYVWTKFYSCCDICC